MSKLSMSTAINVDWPVFFGVDRCPYVKDPPSRITSVKGFWPDDAELRSGNLHITR